MVLGILSWLLALAQAPLVAVPAVADGGCPSMAQVEEALRRRLPGSVVPASAARESGALRLALSGQPESGLVVTLVDVEGHPRLQRQLRPEEASAARDCPALAETVAIIVERYLQELEEPTLPAKVRTPAPADSPPAVASPGRRWDLSLGAGLRTESDVGAYDLAVAANRLLGRSLGLGIEAGMGSLRSWRYADAAGQVELRRLPLSVGVFSRFLAGPGELQAGPILGLDMMLVDARAGTHRSEWRPGPFLGAALAYRLPLGTRGFLRAGVAGRLALQRYEVGPPDSPPVAQTRRVYMRLGLEGGLAFW